jgi:hypothetical protein
MDRKTALDKIRKCLALSKSAQPHEAGAALRQAQKLMALFGIDGEDLDLAQICHHAKEVPKGALSAWQAQLAHLVGDAFGCGHLWARGQAYLPDFSVRRTREVIFYGPDASADLACYTWDVLLRQCIRARAEHIMGQPAACKRATLTARGDRFALGWVAGVRQVVERMSQGGADAANRQRLLEVYSQRTWPQAGTVKPTRRDIGRNVRPDDWHHGAKAGAAADLRRGVATGTDQLRIGAGS